MSHTRAGDYRTLELHHGYVQWLFPIHEEGMNHRAQVLQVHEREAMVQVKAGGSVATHETCRICVTLPMNVLSLARLMHIE